MLQRLTPSLHSYAIRSGLTVIRRYSPAAALHNPDAICVDIRLLAYGLRGVLSPNIRPRLISTPHHRAGPNTGLLHLDCIALGHFRLSKEHLDKPSAVADGVGRGH